MFKRLLFVECYFAYFTLYHLFSKCLERERTLMRAACLPFFFNETEILDEGSSDSGDDADGSDDEDGDNEDEDAEAGEGIC